MEDSSILSLRGANSLLKSHLALLWQMKTYGTNIGPTSNWSASDYDAEIARWSGAEIVEFRVELTRVAVHRTTPEKQLTIQPEPAR